METKQRVSVRKCKHGNRDGFLVCGRVAGALFGISVFVRARETAEKIANVYRTVSDFDRRSALVDGYIHNEAENLALAAVR